MFKKNLTHLQSDLFGMQNIMPESYKKSAEKSEEYHFFKIIFCNIKEEIFAHLYSDKKSRPNSPINAIVASLILMNRKTWTYEELFKQIKFNILVRIALGLDNLFTMPFCMATLFNFQNRLNDHFIKTGENLLEQVFDHLTENQLKALKLKTNIQRTDSTMAASNIRNYSRLQLLIEMILRIYRILTEKDKELFIKQFKPYVDKKTSGQYIYTLKASDIPHELKKVGKLFFWIAKHLKSSYGHFEIFKIFERVYAEHFKIVNKKVRVRARSELHSNCVQSPDDLDATYRDKHGKKSKGQSINVTETANPDNPINLVTDVSVNPSNKDDCKVLNERIDKIQEKAPDLDEIHFDGAYGSEENDLKFEEHQINPIQTAVRGKEASLDIEIEQISDAEYAVRCPYQAVKSERARKRFKARFDLELCRNCKENNSCPAKEMKRDRIFYFTHEDYLRKKRLKRITTIPPDRRKLRNNIEATINEFVCKMHKGKLKVRGAFKTAIFAYSVAISVNFGRIYRLVVDNPELIQAFFSYFYQIVKERFLLVFDNILGLEKFDLHFTLLRRKYTVAPVINLCF